MSFWKIFKVLVFKNNGTYCKDQIKWFDRHNGLLSVDAVYFLLKQEVGVRHIEGLIIFLINQ